ncbi:MAG TPA: DedA family protein [Methanoregula sp.]|nr:DedA family protein [Methanoregula sp.]
MAALVPLTPLALSDQILQYGIWIYLVVFVVILLASTIVGGPIPDNTLLLLAGAVAIDNRLSMEWLFLGAAVGGFAGYEINYWSGRIFGLAVCRGACPLILHDRNVSSALSLMDRFGPVSLVLSRFMPVFNLPSFIAGVNRMAYRRYVGFNLVSSAVWAGILLLLGYYTGRVSLVSEYLDYLTDIFTVVLAAAILLVLFMFARDYLRRNGRPPK